MMTLRHSSMADSPRSASANEAATSPDAQIAVYGAEVQDQIDVPTFNVQGIQQLGQGIFNVLGILVQVHGAEADCYTTV